MNHRHPLARIPLSRRHILGLMGASSLLPATGWAGIAQDYSASRRRVIVIGAGVAGLSAAKALTNLGLEVIVLEGLNRMGGRVLTENLGGVPIDLGASWVTGTSLQNPVSQYLNWIGVPLVNDNFKANMFEEGTGYLTNGQTSKYLGRFNQFISALPGLRNTLGPGASMDQGIELFLNLKNYTGVDRERTRYVLKGEAETYYAGSVYDESLDWFWEDSAFGGGDAFPQGGCGQLVQGLGAGLDVRLNTAVVSVDHTHHGALVHTATESFRASHVLVTVSLGVLKSGAIQFNPALPPGKLGAISRLGMGALEKVVLTFDNKFWSKIDDLYFKATIDGEFPYIKDMTAYAGTPSIVAYAGGDFADQMQGTPPATSVTRILDILGLLTGSTPPAPVDTHVTNWRADPAFGGAYSFWSVGSSSSDNLALGAPAGRIHFAGEATHMRHYGTMQGAMLSGLREAGRILRKSVTVADLI